MNVAVTCIIGLSKNYGLMNKFYDMICFRIERRCILTACDQHIVEIRNNVYEKISYG